MIQKHNVSLIITIIVVIALCISPALQAQPEPTVVGWFDSHKLPRFQGILNQAQNTLNLVKETAKEHPGKTAAASIGILALLGTGYLLLQYGRVSKPSKFTPKEQQVEAKKEGVNPEAQQQGEEQEEKEEEKPESEPKEKNLEKIIFNLTKDSINTLANTLSDKIIKSEFSVVIPKTIYNNKLLIFIFKYNNQNKINIDMALNNYTFFKSGYLDNNKNTVQSTIQKALTNHKTNIRHILSVLNSIEKNKEEFTGNDKITISYKNKKIVKEITYKKSIDKQDLISIKWINNLYFYNKKAVNEKINTILKLIQDLTAAT